MDVKKENANVKQNDSLPTPVPVKPIKPVKPVSPVDQRLDQWPTGLPRPINGIPMDEHGYVQSFGSQDVKEYTLFYDLYGFVVIHDVLSLNDCATNINDIWSIISQKSNNSIKRNDAKTWDNKNWTKVGSLAITEGMVGNSAIFTPVACLTRTNVQMYEVAKTLLKTPDLIVNHDRYGIFRPTSMDPSWATTTNLHLDMNPWRQLGGQHTQMMLDSLDYTGHDDFLMENNLPLELPAVQMLINLADNRSEDGGLQLVPRFPATMYKQWCKSSASHMLDDENGYTLEDDFIRLDENDPLHHQSVRITARAGSLIIWDKRMVHGSCPNRSDQFRYAQFFIMFPKRTLTRERSKTRQTALLSAIPKTLIPLSPHAQQIFGFSFSK
jgi:ectoine hydroxylase-related dioxygenase (phytanoyl-CoA dioxygenase family)